MSEHLPWELGLPTKPDVDALLKAFPPETIKPGEWLVSDTEVAEVLGKNCVGNRYRTVYEAWVGRLNRDYRVIVYRKKGEGFYCPKTADVQANTESKQTHAIRTLRRQAGHVAIAKPTTELETTIQEHQLRLLHAGVRSLKKDRMNLIPNTAAEQPPQIAPPKRAKKD